MKVTKGKKMLFVDAAGAKLVELIAESPHSKDGIYIRYINGGSDTTTPRFLHEIPEGLEVLGSSSQLISDVADWVDDEYNDSGHIVDGLRKWSAEVKD